MLNIKYDKEKGRFTIVRAKYKQVWIKSQKERGIEIKKMLRERLREKWERESVIKWLSPQCEKFLAPLKRK